LLLGILVEGFLHCKPGGATRLIIAEALRLQIPSLLHKFMRALYVHAVGMSGQKTLRLWPIYLPSYPCKGLFRPMSVSIAYDWSAEHPH
jgi:hypothetical protein